MDRTDTNLPDIVLVTPARFGDKRGFFSEIYNRRSLAEIYITTEFIQENHAYFADAGTLRGLDFQCPPATQTKLLRVLRCTALDVCVDIRHGSPTFGQHVMAELTAESGQQILCPKGSALGILTLMRHTEIAYKVDSYYAPVLDLSMQFDDRGPAIDWPLAKDRLILSEKDRHQPWLRDLPEIFAYQKLSTAQIPTSLLTRQ